jgi:hypothetical protein
MASPLTNSLSFPTSKQVPDHAILDINAKQIYLGNQFIYATNSTAISGTSETPLVLMSNPTTNAVSLFHNVRKLTCLTASNSSIFRFYLSPTGASGGTAQVPINLRPASSNTSKSVVTLSPTVSTNGTFLAALASSAFNPDISSLLIIIDPGQVMLVTVQNSATSSVAAELSWYEL